MSDNAKEQVEDQCASTTQATTTEEDGDSPLKEHLREKVRMAQRIRNQARKTQETIRGMVERFWVIFQACPVFPNLTRDYPEEVQRLWELTEVPRETLKEKFLYPFRVCSMYPIRRTIARLDYLENFEFVPFAMKLPALHGQDLFSNPPPSEPQTTDNV